ncbi:Transposable element Tc3 transposase [Folsomia candida]|uniref:Transposable element Tc3 transposase n=1 Tax=Folsomia candida TaxID=158441 RepID=A0A226D3I7_FOLCA|nr:Transposable element Tc3 transposase [Folsomia candida]
MEKNKRLSPFEQGEISALNQSGCKISEIVRQIGRDYGTVKNYIDLGENYGKKNPGGRPPKLTPRDKRRILNEASNQIVSCAQIASRLQLPVSRSTIGRVLNNSPHIEYEKMKGKPPLTSTHKANRLEWARKHMTWSKEWDSIVFSDEKKWNLDGPDGFHSYWHDIRKEKIVFSKRQSGGGSVMIWAAFGSKGRSNVAFIKGTMDSTGYTKMLQEHLLKFGAKMGGRKWIFQQDNASIHSSRFTKDYFLQKKIRVLDWPSKSPDLNPIENFWGILVREVYKNGKQYDNVNQLKTAISTAWVKVEKATLQKLVDSMPNRIFQVISEAGGSTKY